MYCLRFLTLLLCGLFHMLHDETVRLVCMGNINKRPTTSRDTNETACCFIMTAVDLHIGQHVDKLGSAVMQSVDQNLTFATIDMQHVE